MFWKLCLRLLLWLLVYLHKWSENAEGSALKIVFRTHSTEVFHCRRILIVGLYQGRRGILPHFMLGGFGKKVASSGRLTQWDYCEQEHGFLPHTLCPEILFTDLTCFIRVGAVFQSREVNVRAGQNSGVISGPAPLSGSQTESLCTLLYVLSAFLHNGRCKWGNAGEKSPVTKRSCLCCICFAFGPNHERANPCTVWARRASSFAWECHWESAH